MHRARHHSRRSILVVAVLGVLAVLTLTQQTGTSAAAIDEQLDLGAEARSTFTESLLASGGPAGSSDALAALSVNGEAVPMQPFPHITLYGGPNSSGWPFVGTTERLGTCDNNPAVSCAYNIECGSGATVCNNAAQRPAADAPINPTVTDAFAKFPMAILPITPLTDGRTDIVTALRARNPNQLIIGYAVGHVTWCPGYPGNISYPVGYYYRDYYLAVTGGDPNCSTTSNRLLWDQAGTQWIDSNVNLAYREQQPDLSYTYPVAEALAETMYAHTKPSEGFDGLFIDIFCSSLAWGEVLGQPNRTVDYARAGYGNDNTLSANRTAFWAGWTAGHQRLAERLRELAIADGHPNYPISANCGQSPSSQFPLLNGWMRENYPYQNGGTFATNMLTYPWGLLHQDYLFRSPQYNHVFTASEPTTAPYSLYNQQKMRFGLGSTTLGNGYHAFEDGEAAAAKVNYEQWWYDEYGVNTTVRQDHPDYGRATNAQSASGWLGQPKGDYYQYLLPNANPELLPTNGFEQDLNAIHPVTYNTAQMTLDRATSGAPVGNGMLHVNVTNTGTDMGSTQLNSDVFTATSGTYYSLTFWAKATKDRGLGVSIDGATLHIPIHDTWQRYQVSLKATATGNAVYQILLSHETGEVWFDDIRIQAGLGHVLRRDFDRGIVLVNPYQQALTVGLERPFKKILGTVNPTLNDGTVVQSVTLTPNIGAGIGDALFLVEYDGTAPARVDNLQAGP